MKAFLLAGGRGERLRPLTTSVPKCLAPINGTPLLAIWLDLLVGGGVEDVLLNVSHHAEQVRAFIGRRHDGPRVHLVVEQEPIGSAGTVNAHRRFVDGEAAFWIFYADNLTNVRLAPLREFHGRHDGVLTLGLFHAPDPRAAGIVTLGETGRVVNFVEKPLVPQGDLASAGIYLARPALFEHMPRMKGVMDFGHHVLPHLVGQMYGHVIDDFLMDVGTTASLARASAEWSNLAPAKVES